MEKRDVITVIVSKGWKDEVVRRAEDQGQTMASYVRAAINEKMQRDHEYKIKQQENVQ